MKKAKFNLSKLRGLMIEKFGTQARFAEAMGVSQRTMSLKLSGKIVWNQPEIANACDVLGIDYKDIPAYFFIPIVQ